MKTKQIFFITTLIIIAMPDNIMVASQGSFQTFRKKLAEEVQHQLIIRVYFEAQQTKTIQAIEHSNPKDNSAAQNLLQHHFPKNV